VGDRGEQGKQRVVRDADGAAAADGRMLRGGVRQKQKCKMQNANHKPQNTNYKPQTTNHKP
jgi:hypothetical protein